MAVGDQRFKSSTAQMSQLQGEEEEGQTAVPPNSAAVEVRSIPAQSG